MAEDTNDLRVRLVTPDRILFEGTAETVELPGLTGYMATRFGAAPVMTELGAGDVTIRGIPDDPSGETRYNVNWGFAEVLPDRVTILASDALKPEEIDVQRAEQQLDRGLQMWKKAQDHPSPEAFAEAQRVISEAKAKLASAGEGEKD